jgi:hypothetical protein
MITGLFAEGGNALANELSSTFPWKSTMFTRPLGTQAIFLKWLWLVVGGEFVWPFNGLIPQPQPASVPFSAGPLY